MILVRLESSEVELERMMQEAKGICHRLQIRKVTGRGCKAKNCGMPHAEDFTQAARANNRLNLLFLQLARGVYWRLCLR